MVLSTVGFSSLKSYTAMLLVWWCFWLADCAEKQGAGLCHLLVTEITLAVAVM